MNLHLKISASLASLLFLVSLSSECLAQNKQGTITLTVPFLGWYQRDHSMPYDSEFTWGVGAGLNFTENIGAELTFNRLDSDSMDIFMYKLDLLFHLTELDVPGNVVPFVAAGLGDSKYNTNTDKKDDLFVNIGPGVKYYLKEYMALRGDIRYVLEFRGRDRYSNLLVSTGLMFQFGGDGTVARHEPAASVSAPDEIHPPMTAPAEERKCPAAPEGCQGEDWCLQDNDDDGVPDCLDRCPTTPRGEQVDKNGCPPVTEKATFVFRNILFDFRKADLKPRSFPVLDEVAEYLNANPQMRMEIQGHTDSIGSAKFNLNLSRKRAEAVKSYLVKDGGIKEDRLTIKGLGFSRPISTNKTDEGRAKNRRVEFLPLAE